MSHLADLLDVYRSKIYTTKMKEDLLQVRDECLGPKELRTRAAPVKIGSVYQGGTHFERNDRANPVKPNTRCYTIGNTYEGPTKIMAPCKDGKLAGDRDTELLQLRHQLLQVGYCQNCPVFSNLFLTQASSALAMASMEAGPPHVIEHLRINAGLINTPALGVENNVAHSTAQLNIAPAQLPGSCN